jgi:hypothetical protein
MSHLTHEQAKLRRERVHKLMRGDGGRTCQPLTRKQALAVIEKEENNVRQGDTPAGLGVPTEALEPVQTVQEPQ